MIVRRDSRNRIGIVWFDSAKEATEYAARMLATETPEAIADANLGFAQCGRDAAFDTHGPDGCEYAVVTP